MNEQDRKEQAAWREHERKGLAYNALEAAVRKQALPLRRGHILYLLEQLEENGWTLTPYDKTKTEEFEALGVPSTRRVTRDLVPPSPAMQKLIQDLSDPAKVEE